MTFGRIQNEDIKDESKIVADGGTKAQLPNDNKIYMAGAIQGETLQELIKAGRFGGDLPLRLSQSQPTADANLVIKGTEIEKYDGTKTVLSPIGTDFQQFSDVTINFQTGVITGASCLYNGSTITTGNPLGFSGLTIGEVHRAAIGYFSDGSFELTLTSGYADIATVNSSEPVADQLAALQSIAIGFVYLEATSATAFKTAGSATAIIENKVGSDNTIYSISGGFGAGTGTGEGGINYLVNGSALGLAAGAAPADVATASGTATIEVTDTAGELLEGDKSFKASIATQADYVAFKLNASDPAWDGLPLDFSFVSKALGSYAASDFKIYLYNVTDTAEVVGSSRDIPAGVYHADGRTKVILDSSKTYEVRVERVLTTGASLSVSLDQIKIGPQQALSTANVTDWVESGEAITTLLTTNIRNEEMRSRVVGDTLEVRSFIQFDGANTDGLVRPAIPSGYTVDVAKLKTVSPLDKDEVVVGHWFIRYDNDNTYSGKVLYELNAGTTLAVIDNTATNTLNTSTNVPDVITADTIISFEFALPIANSSSNVLSAKRALQQFAYNSDVTDADDTSSFAYGVLGVAYPTTITANRSKRVQLQEPVQKSDDIKLFVYPNADIKLPAIEVHPYIKDGTAEYGISLSVVDSSNVDVVFHKDGAAPGLAWGDGSLAGYKWVVQVVKAGGLAELSAADVGIPGYVTAGTQNIAGAKIFSDDLTVGSTALFVDVSTGDIGFSASVTSGWANRQVVLDAGSQTSAAFVMVNDTTGRTSTDGAVLTLSGSDLYLINRESANIYFRTANVNRAVIDSSGNVGIGTTSPLALLHLNGETNQRIKLSNNNLNSNMSANSIIADIDYTPRFNGQLAQDVVLLRGRYQGNGTTRSGSFEILTANNGVPATTFSVGSTGAVTLGPVATTPTLTHLAYCGTFKIGGNAGTNTQLHLAQNNPVWFQQVMYDSLTTRQGLDINTYFGGNVLAGRVSPTGAWTLGPSGGENHTVNGNLALRLTSTTGSGTLNDFNLATDSIKRFSSSNTKTVTGFTGGIDGRIAYIINLSGPLTLNNEDTGSSAANRIITGTGASVSITADGGATLVYDGISSRWRIVSIVN